MPIVKMPFHMNYLLYLDRFPLPLMKSYLGIALTLCRVTGTQPSFLVHPVDLLGAEQEPQLSFFPGMDVGAQPKLHVFRAAIQIMAEHFDLVPVSAHILALLKGDGLRFIPCRR
jgi:peptidoglycan-N-acetylglucosamine deacetylase